MCVCACVCKERKKERERERQNTKNKVNGAKYMHLVNLCIDYTEVLHYSCNFSVNLR